MFVTGLEVDLRQAGKVSASLARTLGVVFAVLLGCERAVLLGFPQKVHLWGGYLLRPT